MRLIVCSIESLFSPPLPPLQACRVFAFGEEWTYRLMPCVLVCNFYRAMHFSAKRSIAIVYCLSVRLSVTFRYRNHIGWNSLKIISRPNSLRPLLWLTPTWAIWCTFIRLITTTVINNFGKSRHMGVARDSRKFSGCPYIGRIVRSSLR